MLRKIFKMVFFALIVLQLGFFSFCGDDDETPPSPPVANDPSPPPPP